METSQAHTSADLTLMGAALTAARSGVRGANPVVGAAIRASDGRIVTGFHAGAGAPHAEPEAIAAARAAGIDLSTATIAVTLEPCAHTGRTGPCAEAILDAGIPRVLIGAADPNPAAAGGADRLRTSGVDVFTDVRAAEALALNARWLNAVAAGRPFVTLKLAQSIDGKIAAADGTSQWITGPAARQRGHALRARADAIAVGTGTAAADDPQLSARAADGTLLPRQPRPVVIGTSDLPAGHLAANPETLHLRTRDLVAALTDMRTAGIEHVLIEGGAHLAGALLRADLVDELWLFTAPVVLGDGLPGLTDMGISTLGDAPRLIPDPIAPAPERLGDDWLVRLAPASAAIPAQTAAEPSEADDLTAQPAPAPTTDTH